MNREIIGPNEKWLRWKFPNPNLADDYDIVSLQETLQTLIVLLRTGESDRAFRLTCKNVWGYRSTYETYRMGLLDELRARYGSDFHRNWVLFEVKNSEYAAEFGAKHLAHYVVYTDNYILDIVAESEPELEFERGLVEH